MYNPPRFKQENAEEIGALVDRYPLATLISVENGEPVVSHIPLIREGEKLIGHMARANPHWKILSGRPVTAIFHGPQAYITPKWYAENDVPTWNYAVVHYQGDVRLLESYPEVESCLRKLTAHVEKDVENSWEYWLPEDLASPEKVTRSIVGFEISVRRVTAKFKSLKNRSREDQERVVRALIEERGDSVSCELAEMMKRNLL